MSHGKRYSAKERKEILTFLENHTYQETMEKFKVSQMSLARWVKNKKRNETNTKAPLLEKEIQKKIQVYLDLIESMERIRGTAILTAAGELLLSETNGFQFLFNDTQNLSVITSNLLLCAQGFTAAVVNEQKQKEAIFDDVLIKTPVGTFFMHSVGTVAVLVTLFFPEYDMGENFKQDMHFIGKICDQMIQVF